MPTKGVYLRYSFIDQKVRSADIEWSGFLKSSPAKARTRVIHALLRGKRVN